VGTSPSTKPIPVGPLNWFQFSAKAMDAPIEARVIKDSVFIAIFSRFQFRMGGKSLL
jgi:hypothetical protein